MSGKKTCLEPKIVVIDTGVCSSHPRLESTAFHGLAISQDNNNEFSFLDDYTDTVGHGTAICNIIKTHNRKANIFIIKLFDRKDSSTSDVRLIKALEYVLYNIECDIINLSVGVQLTNHKAELYEICERLNEKGVIIISAFDNSGSISYPAVFDNVIGVTTGEFCVRITDIDYVESTKVNICAKGNAQKVAWIGPDYIMSSGNSFACAHVTGIISNLYSTGVTERNLLLEKLKKMARNIYDVPQSIENINPKPPLNHYKRVVLFPFNKEMHSLIRFQHLLNFEIVDVYDIKYKATIGASTNHLLKINNGKDHVIKNIEHIDWDMFDTFILGHTDEIEALIRKDAYITSLINQILSKNKYIYAFDDLSNTIDRNFILYNKEKIFYPKLKKQNLEKFPFGKLYKQSKPVLGVFGTSSQQGKFTLQLILRENLINKGYTVGQIGTEPTAFLFGMDDCFHFGYNSTLEITRYDTIEYMNAKINQISESKADIIIAGCQSGTITYNPGNLDEYTLP